MRRFTWRPNGGSSSQDADDQSFKSDDRTHDPTDSSPARSSSSRGLSAGKARGADGGSPPGVPSATAAFTGGGGGTPSTGGGSSNRKMLKIGRNVRFRGDVMECDTVVVCGRLQGFVESQRFTVKEGGVFVGDAKVEDADIYGTVEGSLESTSRVAIRSTGTLCGTVVYNRMTMEDGAQLEGTYECSSRRMAREAARESGPLEQGAAQAAANAAASGGSSLENSVQARAVALEGVSKTPPRDQSPVPWHNMEGGGAAGDAARVSPLREPSIPVSMSDDTPPQGRQAAVTPTAAARPAGTANVATSQSPSRGFGSNRKPTADAPPPVTPKSTLGSTVGAGGLSSISRRLTARNFANTSPPTAPGMSPSPNSKPPIQLEAVSVKAPGPPVVGQSEASELFSAEVETPKSVSNPFIAHGTMTPVRRSRMPARVARDKSPVADVQSSPAVVDGIKSVAVKIGLWPPTSPTPARTPVTSSKRAEETVTLVSTTTPTSTAEAPTTAAPVSQPPQSAAEVDGVGVAPSVSGGVGVATARSGGGASELGTADDEDQPKEEAEATPAEMATIIKACEGPGCTLEACWGDPRFRPRYCVAHKRQGHKLMDPVGREEGDEAAEPERSATPPNDRPLSPDPQPDYRSREESSDPPSEDELVKEEDRAPPPFLMVTAVDAGLPPPSEPAVAVEDELHDRVQEPGTESEGETGTGDEEESEEDVDEGWDRGGVMMMEANGMGSRTSSFQVQASPGGTLGQQRREREASGRGDSMDKAVVVGGGVAGPGLGATDAEREGDVLARVATYEKLSRKPKAKARKASKRGSGSNIADFYGGGGDSESDDEGSAFSMDTFNKGVLLSQAAEVGTHTEDGQLRPQASQERDQQRLAHLVRVGKLGMGSALRGKGVSTVGKRR